MEHGLEALVDRQMSLRERARIGTAFKYAYDALKIRIERGENPRDDRLTIKRGNGRSDWDELIEGTLITAEKQHEERKVEFLGYMLTNIAFVPEVDGYLANWVLRQAHELTWAQLVLLSIVNSDKELPNVDIGEGTSTWASAGIHGQLADLGYGARGLIGGDARQTPRMGLRYPNANISEQKLTKMGRLLVDLMWLDRVPEREQMEVLRALNLKAELS